MKSGTEGLLSREVSTMLSELEVQKATGVLRSTQFILTVPLLAHLSGIDGARADRADQLPGRTVPKLPEFSVLCNLWTYSSVIQEV